MSANITTMPDQTAKTPVIPQAWLRLLLFGCTFCVIALLIGIPAILTITGTQLDALEKDAVQLLSGLMAGDYLWLMLLLEFLTSVISVGIFRLLIERRSFLGLGWTLDGFTGEALTGFFLDRHAFAPRGLALPESRAHFIAAILRGPRSALSV